jgi:hypothetical protein
MYELTDEQIKVLLVSKDSPIISNVVIENDSSEICVDKFIQSNHGFEIFSNLLSMQYNVKVHHGEVYVDASKQDDIENIIKSELGDDGLDQLVSYTNRKYKEWKIEQGIEEMSMEESSSEPAPQNVFESNTPDEDKDDWDYY